MDESLTSYCGLCCSDCIPSASELFKLADDLDVMLEELEFERYAELKSGEIEEFRDYPTFLAVLRQIRNLRCPRSCRHGGGKPGCRIRECAKARGLAGCWQCPERPGCPLLDGLREIHPHLDSHLDLIRELGPAEWLPRRKEHYRWQQGEKIRKGDRC
jgi:hypothetical protein